MEVVIATQWHAQKEYQLAKGVKRVTVGFSEEEENRYNRLQKIVMRHKKLRDCIKKEQPDVVIAFCVKANYRAAVSMLGMSIPLIISVRSDPNVEYVGRSARIMNRIMEKRANACVFQTKDAKAFFSEQLQKKSLIIYNPMGQQYLAEEKVQERNQTIVTVGRMVMEKDQVLLLQAMKNIHEQFPKYDLKLYGEDGGDGSKEILCEFIEENKMDTYVTLMGVVKDVKKAIKESALFVLSSSHEGMPNALMEAMVMGIPCVSTNCPCGGPASLMEDGKSGLLVPVGDVAAMEAAMIYMIENPEQADEMGKQAMKLLHQVHPDEVYRQWKNLVESNVR